MLLIRKEKLPYFPGLTERAIDVKWLERFKRYWKMTKIALVLLLFTAVQHVTKPNPKLVKSQS